MMGAYENMEDHVVIAAQRRTGCDAELMRRVFNFGLQSTVASGMGVTQLSSLRSSTGAEVSQCKQDAR